MFDAKYTFEMEKNLLYSPMYFPTYLIISVVPLTVVIVLSSISFTSVNLLQSFIKLIAVPLSIIQDVKDIFRFLEYFISSNFL